MTVVGAAPDVLFRYPLLRDTAFPKGRLQPYVSAAPAFLITDTDLDFELGVKVGAGLAWQLHKNVALFTEYRFTHFRPDIERGSFRVSQAGLSTRIRNPRVETDLNTHHILAGISFRF